MSRQAFLADCQAHGIDPTDPKYVDLDGILKSGDNLCPWCSRHGVSNPRAACDLEQSKAAKLREQGKQPGLCVWCDRTYETEGDGSALRIKGDCPQCAARIEAEQVRGRRWASRAVRRDDGLGCVESIHPVELALIARDGGMGE